MNTDFRKGSHINFVDVFQQAKSFASLLTKKKKAIIQLLLCYETHEVAEDELSRSLDLLTHLDENQEYFKTRIGHGAIFLPRNQPLYAFCCFVIVPSLMAEKIHTRLPVSMGGFMPDLLELLEISTRFTNIEISETTRDEFIKQTAEIIYDAETKQKRPLTELVIFTGPTYNSDKVRSLFHKNVLFIANGSGHNPIVVTPTANINRAVESAMRVQLYNQGQDCAAPNSILVHQKILAKFLKQLHKNLSRVKVGPYANSKNTVGPITERKDLNKLCEILSENSAFIDPTTPGEISVQTKTVKPTIILKPLAKGGNFTEQFAPIFFIQEYDSDSALIEYFETEAYAENAMYLTVFGHSEYIDSIKDKYFPCGRKLHPSKTIIHDTDLHAPGIERGVCEYGGYGRGASSVSHRGEINYRPTLPQREIFNFLVKEPEEGKINNNEAPQTTGFVITGNENYYIPEEGKDWRDTLPQMISNASVGLGHSAIEVRVTPAQKPSLAFIREAVVADQLANLTKPKTRLQINFSDLLEIENKSINSISDKEGIFNSLAKRYQYQTKLVLNKLKIITQDSVASEITTTPDFVRALLFTIKQRHLVAETVFQIQRPEVPFKEFVSDYYPVKIRSKYTGNTNTEILSYDGDSTFTYRCLETNQVETTDVTKDKGIIPRDEVLIPILWTLQDTVLTLGDTGQTKRRQHMLYSHIFKLLSNRTSPIYLGVETVTTEKITGRNAQTNKHNLLKKVFDIYDLDVLKWLMIKTEPQDQIQLTFHSDVPRLFDEYDQENGICLPSFREIHSVGQLSNWSDKTITNFISFPNIDFKKMGKRFNFVYNWAKINKVETSPLNDSPHHSYWNSIPDHRQKTIVDLRNFIANNEYSADTINQQVAKLYSHDKQLYTDTYQLLINAERGPRLSNLLYFADKNKILNLLSF